MQNVTNVKNAVEEGDNAFGIIGVIMTDTRDLADIVSCEIGNERKDCFFNNDPYGVVNLNGFQDLTFKYISKYERDSKGGLASSKEYLQACSMLADETYGKLQGIIFCEEGTILIDDAVYFDARIMPTKNGETEIVPFTGEVISSEMDEEDEDTEGLFEALGIV